MRNMQQQAGAVNKVRFFVCCVRAVVLVVVVSCVCAETRTLRA